MNIAPWILQALGGVYFVVSGPGKTFVPWETLMLKLKSCLILAFVIFSSLFGRTVDEISVDIAFKSQGHTLRGKFFQAKPGGNGVTLLLLHGFPGNQQDVLGLGQKLSMGGVNVMTFNYGGTYKSEGEFGMASTLKDIQAAYDYLHQTDIVSRFQIDTGRIVLGGYSYGGGMALTFAAQHPEILRVVSLAGTDHGEFAREYSRNPSMAQMMDSSFDKLKAPEGPIQFEGRGVLKKLAANPDPFDLRLSAGKLITRDILLVGGWDDEQVTIDRHLLPLYRALKGRGATRVTFVAYQTDHSFRNVREELAAQLIQWMRADTAKTK